MNTIKNKNQGCLWTLVGGTIFLLLKTTIFMLFWNWFITNIFQVSYIDFFQSLGLMTFIDFLKFRKEMKEDIHAFVYILDVVLNLLIILFLGYLIHLVLC